MANQLEARTDDTPTGTAEARRSETPPPNDGFEPTGERCDANPVATGSGSKDDQ